MFKIIMQSFTEFIQNIGYFQTSISKGDKCKHLDEKIIDYQPVGTELILEPFVDNREYDSDDEIVIHKQIYRTFSVKAPYNGPPTIVLGDREELVKVYENGQYICTHQNSIEDYGTGDEDCEFKVVYNIVVEN